MKITKLISFYNLLSHFLNFDRFRQLRSSLISNKKKNKSNLYDYGEGFFYQSVPFINLKGLRDTEKRIKKLELKKYCKNKIILDIGTNIGAVPLSLEKNFKKIIAIDHSHETISTGSEIKNFLQLKNIEFVCDDFLSYDFTTKFETILSLANHSTFDQGIKDTKKYFEKILNLLEKDGILVLESHSPLYEKKESFLKLVDQLKDSFKILETGEYEFGNFFDRGRTYCIMRKMNEK